MARRHARFARYALVLGALLATLPATPARAADDVGAIAGVVLDPQGKPVPGARVFTQPMDPTRWAFNETEATLARRFEPRTAQRVVTRSGADGRFQLVGLRAGYSHEVQVQSTKPLGAGSQSVRAQPGTPPETRIVLEPGRHVRGRLVDGARKGVRGSIVVYAHERMRSFAGYQHSSAVLVDQPTDAEGRFAVVLPATAWLRIEARAPGLGARTVSLDAGRAETDVEIALRLTKGCRAHGRVLDEHGKPVAGALVQVSVVKGPMSIWIRRALGVTRAQADGRWAIDGLPPGRVTHIAAWAPGRLVLNGMNLQVPLRREQPYEADLVLGPAARVAGRVLDDEGQPVAGARVTCARAMAMSYTPTHPTVTTDAEGRYAFEAVPLVPGALFVEAKGFAVPFDASPAQAIGRPSYTFPAPAPGAAITKDLRVLRGRVLRGRVLTNAGAGIARAGVSLTISHGSMSTNDYLRRDLGTWTDSDGHFEIRGIQPDADLSLSLSAPGRGHLTTPVKLPRSPNASPLQFVLPRATILVGRVLASDGTPMVGVPVGIQPGPGQTQTDARGGFRLEARTGGTQRVYAGQMYAPIVSLVVDVEPETTRADLVLRWPAGGSLGGVVVDEEGRPVADVAVNIRNPEVRSLTARTWTDTHGRWRIDHAPAGRYGVYVEDQYPGDTEAEPGTLDIRLVHKAKPVAFFDGMLTDADGAAVPRATIMVALSGDGPYAGRGMAHVFGGRFRVLRPAGTTGALSLTVTAARDALGKLLNVLPRRVVVTAKTRRPVQIELERAGEVRGRVLDTEGAAVAGVWLSLAPMRPRPGALRRRALRACTDADGHFHFAGVEPGRMRLSFGYSTAYLFPQPLPTQAGVEDLVIEVQRWGAIAGRLLGLDGQPVPSATVLLTDPNPDRARHWTRATTDAQGRFRFARAVAGRTYWVTAYPREIGNARPAVAKSVHSGDDKLVLRLQRGLAIGGVVRGTDGEPVAGCKVTTTRVLTTAKKAPLWHASPQARTDAEGRFVLQPFEPDTLVHLAFTVPKDAARLYFAEKRGPVAAGTQDLDVRMARAVLIEGVVQGVPVDLMKGLRITARPDGASARSGHFTAYLDGITNTFRIGPLKPGRYRVKPSMRSSGRLFVPGEVQVTAPAQDLVIAVEQAWTISGRVRGKNPRGFVVEFHPPSGKKINTTVKGTDGKFRLGRMHDVAGTLLVWMRGSDKVALVENVLPSKGPFEVELMPGRTISGRILDLPEKVSGGKIIAYRGALRLVGSIVEDGWFETPHLPPGAWELSVEARRPRKGTYKAPKKVQAGARNLRIYYLPPR